MNLEQRIMKEKHNTIIHNSKFDIRKSEGFIPTPISQLNQGATMKRKKRNSKSITHRSRSEIGVSSRSERGFTLIEMIVSVSIFTVVMFVTVGSLLAIADANRKANALRTTMDNLNFAMEAMARNIRTGSNYACEGAGNCPNGGDSFTYVDQDGVTTTYQHNADDQTIEMKRSTGDFMSITSPEVRIEDVTFFVTNVGTDQRQPFVTISIQGAAGVRQKILTEFSVQTSVSQRRVEG